MEPMKQSLFLRTLLCTCWIPILFALIAICWQALRITGQPTEYVALGKIVRGHQGPVITHEWDWLDPNFYSTQIEIIKSSDLHLLALERVRSLHFELSEIDIKIQVNHTKGSTILNVTGTGREPKYTRFYLDALLDEYIAFQKALIEKTTGSYINRVVDEVLTHAKQVKECAREIELFDKQNDIMFNENEHERLVRKASKLQGDIETLKLSNAEEAKLNSVKVQLWEAEKNSASHWNILIQHTALKQKYDDAENTHHELKEILKGLDLRAAYAPVTIMERPTAAVPAEPQFLLPLLRWGLLGTAAGIVVMLVVSLVSKRPETSPSPLN